MDFEARVTALAAVADPARLRIVDVLDAGDASPGELRSQLGLPSNLLAHHLKVLEQAGVVSRHRSHADRRRTYLRLHRDALFGLLPTTAAPGMGTGAVERVVFVCTANSARSQLAAALWHQVSHVPVASGGTHPGQAIAPGTMSAARRHGLRLVQGRPQSLDGLLRDGDYVVTVCDAAHEEASAEPETPVRLAGVSHWSVPDPVAVGTDAAFDAAYQDIAGRVADLAPRLTPQTDATAS
jgi:protein-tyrosine-phosphatase/DNA-binding transcriptional ArsR family regulator